MHIDGFTDDRRLIEFEITGVNNAAVRSFDGECHTVRQAVRDAYEIDLKRPDSPALARRYGVELNSIRKLVLLEPVPAHA